MKQATTYFDFSAKPKVTQLKPKYRQRDQERILDGTNLMNDPRVVRGNTYAAIIMNKNQVQPPPLKKSLRQNNRPKILQKTNRISFDTGFQPITPRAVSGRQHFTTQTQPFVQTLRNKPIQHQAQSQTDLFLDRPLPRSLPPVLQTFSHQTQVDQNDPQLFNFNYQVQPIVQALVGKVIQIGRMQLWQQQCLRQKQKQKINYDIRRHTQLAQAQKLQANQDRKKQQIQRRQQQYSKTKQQQVLTEKKIISRILSKQYLHNLGRNSHLLLQHQGFFRTPLSQGMYQQFLPWLYQQILADLSQSNQTNLFIKQLLNQSQQKKIQQSQYYIDKKINQRNQIIRKKQQQIRRKKQQKQRKKRQQQQRKRLQQQAARKQAQQLQAQKQQLEQNQINQSQKNLTQQINKEQEAQNLQQNV